MFGKVGYKWQVDWWSLGVVFYEILYGKRPFRGGNQDETAAEICTGELIIPEINLYTLEPLIVDPHCVDLITRMLERDVSARICCGESRFEEFKNHPYYEHVDWELLEGKLIDPPFIPEANKDNFDISHDLEELLLDDNPLRYKGPDGGEGDDEDDSAESGGPVPQRERLNRSETGEKEPAEGKCASEKSHHSELRFHPLDYDPYLQALQRNESPYEKGRLVTPAERIDMELTYIKANFTDYNVERDGRMKPIPSFDRLDDNLARSFSHLDSATSTIPKSSSYSSKRGSGGSPSTRGAGGSSSGSQSKRGSIFKAFKGMR
jgi:serine/threonine protein kinase